jgi:hypothetical protein
MSQTAAHLVDHVIAHVPVRQWVLSLPIPLRLLLATQPELVTPVLQVVQRVLTRHLPDNAGLEADEGHGGAVTLIQRFGSAANLNIHLHGLLQDGVYRCGADGVPQFVEVGSPTDDKVHALLQAIITRLMKMLTRHGVLVEDMGQTYVAETDADGDEARTLRPLQAAAVSYRIAFGPRAGQKVLSLRGAMPRESAARQTLCAGIDGFSLHAAVRVEAHDRKRLEQLCRYITRPALSDERVQLNAAGQVELKLKTPWRDGTTHLVMSPLEFMQRLAALVPRPRLHLIRFHGVLSAATTPRAGARGGAGLKPPGPRRPSHTSRPRVAKQDRSRGSDARRFGATPSESGSTPKDGPPAPLVNGPRNCRHRTTRPHGRPIQVLQAVEGPSWSLPRAFELPMPALDRGRGLGLGVVVRRQPVHLLHVEDRIALHEVDIAPGLVPGVVGLGLRHLVGIDHQGPMLALAHLGAQRGGLLVGHPDGGTVALGIGLAPQQQDIDASMGLVVSA